MQSSRGLTKVFIHLFSKIRRLKKSIFQREIGGLLKKYQSYFREKHKFFYKQIPSPVLLRQCL